MVHSSDNQFKFKITPYVNITEPSPSSAPVVAETSEKGKNLSKRRLPTPVEIEEVSSNPVYTSSYIQTC